MDLRVMPVADLDEAWPTLEPLVSALHSYHYPLVSLPLQERWADIQRCQWDSAAEGIVFIAQLGDQVVGFVNGTIERNRAIFVEEFANLDNMFVTEPHRHAGIGKALLQAFEDWSVVRGVTTLRLGVVAANDPARRFWSEMGFEPATLRLIKRL